MSHFDAFGAIAGPVLQREALDRYAREVPAWVGDVLFRARVWRGEHPEVCPDCHGSGLVILGDGGGGIGKPHYEGCTYECDRCRGEGVVAPPGPWCSARLP